MDLKHQALVTRINQRRRRESRGYKPFIWAVIGLFLILLLIVRR